MDTHEIPTERALNINSVFFTPEDLNISFEF